MAERVNGGFEYRRGVYDRNVVAVLPALVQFESWLNEKVAMAIGSLPLRGDDVLGCDSYRNGAE